MNAHVDHVLLEALALEPAERSLIALSLLDSLQGDGATDADVTASWIAEAKRRDEDITDARTKAMPLNEFSTWFNSR